MGELEVQILLAIITLISALAIGVAIFKPGAALHFVNALTNWIQGAIQGALPILASVETSLAPVVAAFVAAFNTYGPTISGSVSGAIEGVVAGQIAIATANLVATGKSTPDNAVSNASAAMTAAFGFGVGSAAVTAAFEAAFPEKLNTLNGVGPMLAQMAGFSEVSAEIRNPLYRAAFGKSAEYHFNSLFSPNLPSGEVAAQWLARGVLTPEQFNTLFSYSGINPDYQTALTNGSYRPVSPFILARAVDTGALTDADLQDVLTFGGYRPIDATRLITAFDAAALAPYLSGLVSAIVTAAERGTISIADLPTDLQNAGVIAPAIPLIVQTVSYRRLEQLAELYRKSISEGYQYGTITDADYVTDLEAIGIGEADAEAHYAIDSIKKLGKAAATATRAAASLVVKQQRAAMQAAIAQYRNGTYDEAELSAALLLTGIDPGIAGYSVTIQSAKRAGNVVYVYGLTLPRDQAVQLRENVAALEKQVTAQLVGYTAALQTLEGLGIPTANATSLLAAWTATITPAADVGVKEPL